MKPEMDLNLPLIISKAFLANGRRLKVGEVLNWKKAGITIRRMKQLYEQGWIHHAHTVSVSGSNEAVAESAPLPGSDLFTFDGTNGIDESVVSEAPKKRGRKPKVQIDSFVSLNTEPEPVETIDTLEPYVQKTEENVQDEVVHSQEVEAVESDTVETQLVETENREAVNSEIPTETLEMVNNETTDPEIEKPVTFWGDV